MRKKNITNYKYDSRIATNIERKNIHVLKHICDYF